MPKQTQKPANRRAGVPAKQTNQRREDPPPQHNDGPVDKVRLYPVEAAIWSNYSQEGKLMYSVSFQRSYKDRNGEWKRSTSFSGSDLLVLAAAANLAYHKIVRMRAEDSAEASDQPRRTNGHAVDEDVPF